MIKFDFVTYNKINDISKYGSKLKDLNSFFEKNKENMGWFDLNNLFDQDKIFKIKQKALFIKENSEIFIVVGIGGSYMGAQAIIEALSPYLKEKNVIFAGNSLSTEYLNEVLKLIEEKSVIINVISKSGNTLEVLATYDVILSKMKEKYSDEELNKRIIITTESSINNTLYKEGKEKGYEIIDTFKNIGGRFSVFTEAGLLPVAVANLDIENLINGAKEAMIDFNDEARYSIVRDAMLQSGKLVEAYTTYEPKLHYFLEWIKQLYAESLGKSESGILPISIINTRDLHSMGQYLQDGPKIIFETLFVITNTKNNLYLERYQKNLSEINNIAYKSVSKAHLEGEVNSSIFELTEINEANIGYLLQFFMVAVTISGLLENNEEIFTQYGVENYKNILQDMLKE